jgi:hypothetical protein
LSNANVVVDDLEAAITFFTTLGMTVEGKAPIEGEWVDRINALEGVQVESSHWPKNSPDAIYFSRNAT